MASCNRVPELDPLDLVAWGSTRAAATAPRKASARSFAAVIDREPCLRLSRTLMGCPASASDASASAVSSFDAPKLLSSGGRGRLPSAPTTPANLAAKRRSQAATSPSSRGVRPVAAPSPNAAPVTSAAPAARRPLARSISDEPSSSEFSVKESVAAAMAIRARSAPIGSAAAASAGADLYTRASPFASTISSLP